MAGPWRRISVPARDEGCGRPQSPIATARRCNSSLHWGDYRGGLLLTEELQDKGKPTADHWFYRGAFLLELGTDDAQAEESLRNCIPMQESPQLKALTLSTLALVLIRRERYDEAQRCIEDALLCWPRKGSFFRDLAEISLRRGDNPTVALELARKGWRRRAMLVPASPVSRT